MNKTVEAVHKHWPPRIKKISQYFCIFVCWEFILPLENFSLIWRRQYCRWRAANFDQCSALMVIEQWGFFNVLHLLWHGPTVYNGHLRVPMTLTLVAKLLAVELSLPVFTTSVEPRSPACETNALPLRHRGGYSTKWNLIWHNMGFVR